MVKITTALVARSAKDRQKKDETLIKFVSRQSHLMLQGKGIHEMSGLSLVPAKSCTSLYLYDNRIREISGLAQMHGLRDIYLQNNELTELTNLQACQSLERLFAENNQIGVLSGLTECRNLRELHLGGQRLEEHQSFCFDEASLSAISHSLAVLDVNACQIEDPSPVALLGGLQHLNLAENRIMDPEVLEEVFPRLQRLQTLMLIGNPIATGSAASKTRQSVVMLAPWLQSLDEKDVLTSERSYVAHVQRRMEEQRSLSPPPMPPQHIESVTSVEVVQETADL